jgi:N-acetylmuramoyl-L-alanine amidase
MRGAEGSGSAMKYKFVAAPDHWPRTTKIRAIVIHMAEGGGTVPWLTHPDGNSSHYVVEYSGCVVQMVDEKRAAGSINPKLVRPDDDKPYVFLNESVSYGATAAKAALGGSWKNPNAAVIAIEIEGFAKDGPNDKQRAALGDLVADIRSRHGHLPALGHRDFQSYKQCPGHRIAWADFGGHGSAVAAARAVEVDEEEAEVVLKFRILEAAPGTVRVAGGGHSLVTLDGVRVPISDGQVRECVAKVELLTPLDAAVDNPATPQDEGDRTTAWLVGKAVGIENTNTQAALLLSYAGTFTRAR